VEWKYFGSTSNLQGELFVYFNGVKFANSFKPYKLQHLLKGKSKNIMLLQIPNLGEMVDCAGLKQDLK
jgi:hypothetical protein